MLLPTLEELNTSRELIDVFGGYNHNLRIGGGEFYDMKNLTSDNYPVLSPRKPRGVAVSEGAINGIIGKDELCYIDGSDFVKGVKGDVRVDLGLDTSTPKTLVSMGAYVIILPDKKYINTTKLGDHGSLEAEVESASTYFALCDKDGKVYDLANVYPDTEPPIDNKYTEVWWNTSTTPPTANVYSAANKAWVKTKSYIKISGLGSDKAMIGKPFEVGDSIRITMDDPVDEAVKHFNNTNNIIVAKGDDNIVVEGWLPPHPDYGVHATVSTAITFSRPMPKMDFIIESGNRLWGCRYGETPDGQFVNEIYASALGDFKNWYKFEGISTDSYAASVGSDGAFTGAINYFGTPLFFKENYLHKVYGNYPSNYQIQTTACRGVQDGCHKSLAVVNEVLYFKARQGVCAYDGSLPVEVSSALGSEAYSDAAAGALGNKYYISMKDAHGGYHMFVYDTAKGLWHREDDTQASEFCNCRGELYYIDYAVKQIKTVLGTGVLDTSAVEWEAITGTIGTDMPDKKYISRLDVRMLLNVGASVSIYVEYDSSGAWEHLLNMNGTSLRSFALPIRPKRCDHLRLRIVGRGDAKIFSICKNISQGSDI